MLTQIKHKSLTADERSVLKWALERNANDGHAILIGNDSSFAGVVADVVSDAEVVNAIKSVPCHY